MDDDDRTRDDHDDDPDLAALEEALAHLIGLRLCLIPVHRRAQQRQHVRNGRLAARARKAQQNGPPAVTGKAA